MEPMSLGSPGGVASNEYLPAFLMGNLDTPNSIRHNQLSPVKDRQLSFGPRAPQESPFGARTNNQQPSETITNMKSCFGPPTLDLYDDIPPVFQANSPFSPVYSRKTDSFNISTYTSPSVTRIEPQNRYANHTPAPSAVQSPTYSTPLNESQLTQQFYNNSQCDMSMSRNYLTPKSKEFDFWVTVFGYPQDITIEEVVEYFKRCGVVTDVRAKPNCNFMSIRYTSRFESHAALMYNGKCLKPGIMIGVMACDDPEFVGSEGLSAPNDNMDFKGKLERLKMMTSPQTARAKSPTPQANRTIQRSDEGGIVNRAVEYLFGW